MAHGENRDARRSAKAQRQAQRQQAHGDRVSTRVAGRVAAVQATGTRAGDAWVGTVDHAIDVGGALASDALGHPVGAADGKTPGTDGGSKDFTDTSTAAGFDPIGFIQANPIPSALGGALAAKLLGII